METSRTPQSTNFHRPTWDSEQLQRCLSLIVYHYEISGTSIITTSQGHSVFTPSKSSFRSRQIEIMVCCYWKGQEWRNFCNQTVSTPISVSGCVIVWTLAITFDIQYVRLVKACSNSTSTHRVCGLFSVGKWWRVRVKVLVIYFALK